MKTYSRLTLAFLLLAMVGCGKDVTTYHPNGQKESEGSLRDNKEHGLWTWWYENGQKWREIHYKDGSMVLETHWRENGQKSEGKYKNGKLVLETHWYENGQKSEEIHYKNGKEIIRKELF